MALRIPDKLEDATRFCKDLADECMVTAEERQGVYEKAAQYYYTGSGDVRAAIHNKVKNFIERMSGYLYQPGNVRFNTVFNSHEPKDVLDRGRAAGELLTAEFRSGDADLNFSTAVTWSLNCGCYFLKHVPEGLAFKAVPVHPVNMGVLTETTVALDEQEAFCHVSYPTLTKLRTDLIKAGHPNVDAIVDKIMDARRTESDQGPPTYFHSMVVGGLNPLGDVNQIPAAAGITQVFPIPTPWRPQRKIAPTLKHCELWIKDEKTGDYTTMQLIYPDILIQGDKTRVNISGIPEHHPFVKVESDTTPGYFWGRSTIADVQMLQDVINKRLRDLKITWDRNAAAPYSFSGFTSITEESYYKLISEGGFIADPNPNAKAAKLTEPPPPGYLEELEFLWKMFDESGGFTPIMTGQGEPGVRAGVHAQTLVRTSSPGLIDPATRIERQAAESGYLCMRLMQNNDPTMYETDTGIKFLLEQLPEKFQVEVDSHSASPAFAEDSRQIAIALAKAQAIGPDDLIEMLHPPNAELLLARLKQRQAAAAKAQEEAAARGLPPPGQEHSRSQHR
jgi:hypothetical protein